MKLKISVVLGFLLFLSFQSAFSQNSRVDSLQKEIEILQLKNLIDSLRRAKAVVAPVVPVEDDEYISRQEALKKDILNLNNEMSELKMNLDLCHKTFKRGLLIEIGGAAAAVLGYFVLASSVINSSSSNTNAALGGLALYVGGMGAVIYGNIVMTNSHKYIGYAGQRKASYTRPSNLYTR